MLVYWGFCLPSTCLALDPAPIAIAGAALVPSVSVQQEYYDNLLLQAESTRSSAATVFSPQLDVSLGKEQLSIVSQLGATLARFWQSREDDYDNAHFDGQLTWRPSLRHSLIFGGSLAKKNERRGTGFSAGSGIVRLSAPDTYNEADLEGVYRFGAKSARGRLEFAGGRYSREYTSREAITQVRNRQRDYLSSTFFLGLGGRVAALLELEVNTTDYDELDASAAQASLDSDGVAYLIGLNWQASGKTRGDIRLGYAEKVFAAAQREDFSGLSWRASATWSPKSYSDFKLKTGRRPIETDGAGSFIDEQTWSLAWQHRWSRRFNTAMEIATLDRDYQQSFDNRSETINRLSVECYYRVQRWLVLGFALSHEEKDSNLIDFEYQSNVAALNIELSL